MRRLDKLHNWKPYLYNISYIHHSEGLFTCQLNATCVDLIWADDTAVPKKGYRCDCDPGFKAVAQFCRDVDECADDPDLCDANADCINTEGSYKCECHTGFSGNGTTCENVDECQDIASTDCHVNATCSDTTGSHDCECNEHYFGDGEQCYDVDECQTSDHNCCVTAGCFCTNGVGYHTCGCEDG